MENIATQMFYGLFVELLILIVAYLAKDKKEVAITVFFVGTFVAGVVAFAPIGQPNCAYTSDTDSTTITNIIEAEAEAANNEDISIIRTIFSPNATIRFEGDGGESHDPVARYQELFESSEISNAVHFSIRSTGLGITDDTAWFVSGSSGLWTPNGEESIYYYNEPGKDSWILKKNQAGCWVIVEYGYN